MNGTTWLDRTNYFQNVPTTAIDMALWMESDRMGHFLGAVDQKVLDEQRGVVQNEKREGENQPYGQADDEIYRKLYPREPSLSPQHDRFDERPQRRRARRREGVVPRLVRTEQRGVGAGRRHRCRHGQGQGRQILRVISRPGRRCHASAQGRYRPGPHVQR